MGVEGEEWVESETGCLETGVGGVVRTKGCGGAKG